MNLFLGICMGWFIGSFIMLLYLDHCDLIRTHKEWESSRKKKR